MNQIKYVVLAAAAAVVFTACGAPAGNTPAANSANANTNTTKTTAAAPTADALMALDKQANEAYLKGDGKFFDGFLSDKFVMRDGEKRINKAAVVDMISKTKCESKSFELTEPQMATVNADTYILIYKGTFDGTCTGPDGKPMKIPSPPRPATIWVRSGDKWQAAFHGQNVIVDPKALPPAPAAKKEEPKQGDKAAGNSNA